MLRNNYLFRLVVGLAALWAMAYPAHAQAPGPFKADLQMSGGRTPGNMQAKIFFSSGKVRMEMAMGGQNQVMISDTAKSVLYMVMPADKMYMEMNAHAPGPMRTPKVDSVDPANPCSNTVITSCKKLGTETVNGYATEKWEFKQASETVTAWVSTKLRFPIKSVTSDGLTVEFRNIVEGEQPATLFTVPAGFEKMDMGGMMRGMGGMPPQ